MPRSIVESLRELGFADFWCAVLELQLVPNVNALLEDSTTTFRRKCKRAFCVFFDICGEAFLKFSENLVSLTSGVSL